MAGTVQRLIRHVFDTVGVPIALQNKMFKFTEDSDASRDRSRIVAQGPTGLTHEWWTVEEAQDYISNEISSIGNSSPWVIVGSWPELVSVASLEGSFNVWCDDGSGEGIVVDVTDPAEQLFNLPVLGNKFFYGPNDRCLTFKRSSGSDVAKFKVTLPDSGFTGEVQTRFYSKVSFDYNGLISSVSTVELGGDYNGSSNSVYFSEINAYNGVGNENCLELEKEAGQTGGKLSYEVLNTGGTANRDTQYNANYGLWSGKHTVGKASENTYIYDNFQLPTQVATGLIQHFHTRSSVTAEYLDGGSTHERILNGYYGVDSGTISIYRYTGGKVIWEKSEQTYAKFSRQINYKTGIPQYTVDDSAWFDDELMMNKNEAAVINSSEDWAPLNMSLPSGVYEIEINSEVTNTASVGSQFTVSVGITSVEGYTNLGPDGATAVLLKIHEDSDLPAMTSKVFGKALIEISLPNEQEATLNFGFIGTPVAFTSFTNTRITAKRKANGITLL